MIWLGSINPPDTSYTNAGGSGDRTSWLLLTSDWSFTGNISNLVDGGFGANTTDGINPTSIAAGKVITFDFGVKKFIRESKLYWAWTTAGTLSLKWRGSDDGSSWTDASAAFTFTATTITVPITAPFAGWRYYQLLSAGGSLPDLVFTEVEFDIAPGEG
jgi:hypothetical protein